MTIFLHDGGIGASMNTMTFDGAQFGRDLAAEVRTYLARAIAPLEARIAALEQENTRLKEMIAQRPFTYMGVFKEGATYNLGAFVTFDGGPVALQPALHHDDSRQR